MLPRFFCPQLQTGPVRLDDSEAHHLGRVLRLSVGAEVELFDGQGHHALAVVRAITSKSVQLEAARMVATPPAQPDVHVATAVPKGERVDWLVEKLTELGVRRWTPLVTTRSSVEPRDTKLDRLRQLVISACKQCRQNTLLEIGPLTPIGSLWPLESKSSRLIADATGTPLAGLQAPSPLWTIAIGPEGGWTPEELQTARDHGWDCVRLGDTILRIETAAIAVASALFWGAR